MNRFIPFNKLSKKKKAEINKKRRRTWNGVSPVTRRPSNPNAYNRKREKASNLFTDKMVD